jgi:hypothetical protein
MLLMLNTKGQYSKFKVGEAGERCCGWVGGETHLSLLHSTRFFNFLSIHILWHYEYGIMK